MIGKKHICAVVISFIVSAPCFAQWVVTDPTSYMYYVQQLEQQAKLVTDAAKQVETMGGVLTETKKIQENLTGNYNRATDLVNRLKGVSDAMKSQPADGIFAEAKKWGDVGRVVSSAAGSSAATGETAIKDINGSEIYVDTKKILDATFGDPRDAGAINKYRATDRIYQVKQDALKGVVAKSEQLLNSAGDRLKVIEALANAIDQTKNQKDAQDLTNRILVEMLTTLNEMLQIAAQANQAEALYKYTGAKEKTMEQRQKALSTTSSTTESSLDSLLKNSTGNRAVY